MKVNQHALQAFLPAIFYYDYLQGVLRILVSLALCLWQQNICTICFKCPDEVATSDEAIGN